MNALQNEGFKLTQATLSRDLKQLKVAKAATIDGDYVYVLPNDSMYRRVPTSTDSIEEMMKLSGFESIHFSGNMAVIKTRSGYASSLAYDIDTCRIPEILGTIAGSDTIFMVIREHVSPKDLMKALNDSLPELMKKM